MKLLNIKIHTLSYREAIYRFEKLFDKKTSSIVSTVNAEFIEKCKKDSDFLTILNSKTSLNLIDGAGIIWALYLVSRFIPKNKYIRYPYVILEFFFTLLFIPLVIRIQHKRGIDKISGSDFIWNISKIAVKNEYRVFILGYSLGLDQNIAQKTSLKLQTEVYGLKICGSYSSTESIEDEEKTISIIKHSDPDILLVGFGAPKQEKWLVKNLSKTGAKVGIGLGGTFDFVTDIQKRSPKWIQSCGLEWLFRLIQNPRRIKRQTALPRFAYDVLKERLKDK